MKRPHSALPVKHSGSERKTEPKSYWLEQYWPRPNRDVSTLYMWFHEKKEGRDALIKAGDRVLFYETKRHPDPGERFLGAQTVFASGTVTGKREYIPNPEQLMGGKRWLFKRVVHPEYSVPPAEGVPLAKVKELLGLEGWPQAGFEIKDPGAFDALEKELRLCQEKYNEKIAKTISTGSQGKTRPFAGKVATKFSMGDQESDPAARLAALEQASNTHKEILNKLDGLLKSSGYESRETTQIDLLAQIGDQQWLFEVKSSHENNYLTQVRHGVAQLYEYRYRWASPSAKLCLVMQTVVPSRLEWLPDYLNNKLEIALCWPVPQGFQYASGEINSFLRARPDAERAIPRWGIASGAQPASPERGRPGKSKIG